MTLAPPVRGVVVLGVVVLGVVVLGVVLDEESLDEEPPLSVDGALVGVTADVAPDAFELPTALVATTVNV
jgi:hypothetical protein